MYRTQETGFRINNPRTKLSFFLPLWGQPVDRIIVFSSPLFPPPFPLPPLLLPARRDQRSRSRSWLADCRSLAARHVSPDFPIKPAQRVSIDANQRLLSACPPILHLFTIALDRATLPIISLPAAKNSTLVRSTILCVSLLLLLFSFFSFRFPLTLFLDRLSKVILGGFEKF